MGYLQCIFACINRGVNLLHPLSMQCHLLRLTPLHQTPLSTHACISPAHPRCCCTHLRCHSAPLHCTANNSLQVCSTIASGCTFYLAETLTVRTYWCGSFAANGVWYRITSYCIASSYTGLSGRPDPPTFSESSQHHDIFTIFTTCKCLVDTYTTTTLQNFALCIKLSLCPPWCTCTLNLPST